MRTILVTGGAGFIGSALVRALISDGYRVINVDKLTYAGNLDSLGTAREHPEHFFHRVDICDGHALRGLFAEYRPDGVIHLAAESHVDRSIDDAGDFVRTNIVGTYTLLEEARRYWNRGSIPFRLLHVSTDEVFGSLGSTGLFKETTSYSPRSPYSASKAGSDHFARAWHHTYGLPVIVTNCSNNYGPYQFPEKLIPLTIQNALHGKPVPVYGRGENVRDWLYVEDHVEAIRTVFDLGTPGETYNVGGKNERKNLEVVEAICELVNQLAPDAVGNRHELITFVPDRPGHDFRYAIDTSKIERELDWKPRESFESGLRKTVEWYLANQEWCERVQSGAYRGERLGLANQA